MFQYFILHKNVNKFTNEQFFDFGQNTDKT